MKPKGGASGPILQVHPHCLMFFVDDTGHEQCCYEPPHESGGAPAPDYESGGQEFESLRARHLHHWQRTGYFHDWLLRIRRLSFDSYPLATR